VIKETQLFISYGKKKIKRPKMKRKAIVKRILISCFGMGKEKKGRIDRKTKEKRSKEKKGRTVGRGRKKNEIG
jgi:hypothetical protein